MKIIIAGAGEVGFHIAQRLASERKEVVVIDRNAEALRRFSDLLDVKTIHGSGSSPKVLEEAGLKGAEAFLAVTDRDETNLVACMFVNALFPGILKLARIRNDDYIGCRKELTRSILNINKIINPEEEVVTSIVRAMSVPGAEDVSEFAEGRVKLIAMRIREHAPIAGTRLLDLLQSPERPPFVVAAIFRREHLIVPTGKSRIDPGDLVYFVCNKNNLERVLGFFGGHLEPVRNVLLVGGGNLGLRLARHIEGKSLHIRLVEQDEKRCRFLVEQLHHTIVLHGDGTDKDLLEQEDIAGMDLVVTLTGQEEVNVLCSLLARQLGARHTITRLNKFAYFPIAVAIDLGHIVSPRLSVINSIVQYVRRGRILSTFSLKGEEGEILEAVALEHSGIVGKPLKNLKFPKGALVLAVLRGDESIIPGGNTVIEPRDRVIILSTRKNLPRVERELMVGLESFKPESF